MITKQNKKDLQRSWGDKWQEHTVGKATVEKKAKALLAKMKGKGWRIYISENLGWHYRVTNLGKHLTLSEYESKDGTKSYSCLMGFEYAFSGSGFWTEHPSKNFTDPNEAVQYQIQIAREFTNQCDTLVKQAEAIYG